MAQSNVVVLVVDDDPDILEALSEVLGLERVEVQRARNGLEALQILERLDGRRPDLILLDLMMPVMDGWEFARRLREHPLGKGVPIIILSADRNVGSKAGDLRAVGHLAKPFDLDELIRTVRLQLATQARAASAQVGEGA